MYWHTFCLNYAKCWFYSLDPIVKFAHCQQYDLACLYCSQQTNSRDRNVGNVQILQQELMSKKQHFAVMRQKVSLYIHVVVLQSGLPSLDGKLERFVTKKMEKAIAKLESDRQ